MGVAYYIVFDKDEDELDFDVFVNGKNIARVAHKLDKFCKQQGLNSIFSYHFQDLDEFADASFADDLDDTKTWFDAQEGIDWVTVLIDKMTDQQPRFATDALFKELQEYLTVFKQAQKANLRWHLEMDT